MTNKNIVFDLLTRCGACKCVCVYIYIYIYIYPRIAHALIPISYPSINLYIYIYIPRIAHALIPISYPSINVISLQLTFSLVKIVASFVNLENISQRKKILRKIIFFLCLNLF